LAGNFSHSFIIFTQPLKTSGDPAEGGGGQ
jgi:hypothetical protein